VDVLQVLLTLTSVGLAAFAQVLLKLGASSVRDIATTTGGSVQSEYQAMLSSPTTLIGLAIYIASALLWLRVLATVPLSQAYPFVALGFVITTAAGFIIFGEPIVFTRVAGMIVILAGVFIISYR
jgi:multidrug transporter EmrE-like cation transporter